MSWVKRQGVLVAGTGKTTQVKTKKGAHDLTNLERAALAQTIEESRRIVGEVIGLLMWNVKTGNGAGAANIDALAGRYFKTGGALTTDQRNLVIAKLELVHNALNLSVNVKLHARVGSTGAVRYQGGATGVARGIFEPGRNLGTRGADTVSRGDIRLQRSMFGGGAYDAAISNDDMAVLTFIHEATHKYASTADHGNDGYIHNDGQSFWANGLTMAQALNNADSYAWFCFAATR
jgi:hypothetical protein